MPYLFRAVRPRLSSSHILALIASASVAPLLSACGGTVDSGSHETATEDSGPPATIIVLPPPVKRDAATDTGTDTDAGGDDAAPQLFAIPLSSCLPSEYTAAVTIGGSQTFELDIDTGSTTLGVASAQCTSCGQSLTYTPGPSATNENQTGFSQYGSGSWSGEIYEDSVQFAAGAVAPVSLVAIDSQSQFFEPAQCDSSIGGYQGIVGFGPSGSALQGTNGFMDQLVATTHIPNVFATELCDSGGTLWLGGFDPTFTTAAPQYTPLDPGISQYYYAVNLVSVTVNGTTVPVATEQFSDSIVDTGTSIFILPSAAFNGITNAIASTPEYKQVFGITPAPTPDGGASDAGTPTPVDNSFFTNSEACATLGQTKAELDAMLPPLTFNFGSNPSIAVQALPTESYLMAYEGEWCPTLYAMDPSQDDPLAAIVGSPILRSNIVIFDRANSRIGFAPHTACAQ